MPSSSSSSLENNTARGFERVVVSKPSLRVVSLSLSCDDVSKVLMCDEDEKKTASFFSLFFLSFFRKTTSILKPYSHICKTLNIWR